MSNPISRRTFLKCTGASAVALGAAGLLGGCQQSGGDTIVDVKVGDKVLVGQYAGSKVKLDGEEYTIVRQSEVLAIVE